MCILDHCVGARLTSRTVGSAVPNAVTSKQPPQRRDERSTGDESERQGDDPPRRLALNRNHMT